MRAPGASSRSQRRERGSFVGHISFYWFELRVSVPHGWIECNLCHWAMLVVSLGRHGTVAARPAPTGQQEGVICGCGRACSCPWRWDRDRACGVVSLVGQFDSHVGADSSVMRHSPGTWVLWPSIAWLSSSMRLQPIPLLFLILHWYMHLMTPTGVV